VVKAGWLEEIGIPDSTGAEVPYRVWGTLEAQVPQPAAVLQLYFVRGLGEGPFGNVSPAGLLMVFDLALFDAFATVVATGKTEFVADHSAADSSLWKYFLRRVY
jgi:hypothetical protein